MSWLCTGLFPLVTLPAVLSLQVKKAYGKDFNSVEAHEEMARMREHALTEVSLGQVLISISVGPGSFLSGW